MDMESYGDAWEWILKVGHIICQSFLVYIITCNLERFQISEIKFSIACKKNQMSRYLKYRAFSVTRDVCVQEYPLTAYSGKHVS